jgi:hypothetical protein
MQQSIAKCYYFVVQTLLNMFRALLCPSSGARQTAVAVSVFRMNVEHVHFRMNVEHVHFRMNVEHVHLHFIRKPEAATAV